MGTTIYLTNQAGSELDVSTQVAPPLRASDWSITNQRAPAATARTPLLQFNRDEGITDGMTWVFTTSFLLDGVTVSLQEQVTGTALASTMLQGISASVGSSLKTTTNFQSANRGCMAVQGTSGAIYQISWSLSGSGMGFDDITYTVQQLASASARVTPIMPQIETVIVLTLENRSLDQVLGWLYSNTRPAFVYPEGSAPNFDGIQPGAGNMCNGNKYVPARGTAQFAEPCRVPAFDPYEPIEHVKRQLYADGTGNMPTGNFWQQTPPMTGFARDYFASYEIEPTEIMGAYEAEQLPVLYGLAQNFAVSDRWFCSVPTQTDPNRAFSVCGTSNGAEQNSDIDGQTFAGTPTVFNWLGAAGKTWGLFWQADNPAGTGEPLTSWQPYTSYYFPMMNQAPNGGVLPYAQFLTLLAQGKAPNFCYLEPCWGGGKGCDGGAGWVGIQGNDYHPPAWVGPGEADLNALYQAIVRSPQWPRTLFVITFDEHGGTWDHVAPPAAIQPDDHVSKSGFQFNRLGVRVPAILVSPYVRAGTVFRAPAGSSHELDHTSLIATLLKWAGVNPAAAGMGRRVAAAPTFEGVLAMTARGDVPTFSVPAGYAQQGGGTGHVNVSLLGSAALDVRDFREAIDSSDSAAELTAKLQALTAKPNT